MKNRVLLLFLAFLLFSGCNDDNGSTAAGPAGNGAGKNVIVSGEGASTEFQNFQFAALDFFGTPFIVISGINGPDSLVITLFQLPTVNSPIALSDSLLFIVGTFGSAQFLVSNQESTPSGFVSVSLTFSTVDTAQTMVGAFASGSSLAGAKLSDGSSFQASISGEFSASK